jgi:hypothetical protein
MSERSGLNAGKEWSKKDLFSLRNRIEHGRTVAHCSSIGRSPSATTEFGVKIVWTIHWNPLPGHSLTPGAMPFVNSTPASSKA